MRRAGLSATADTCIDNYQLRSVLGDVIFSLVPQFVVAHVISPAMLQDIIEDDAIKLDWFFKASLVQDLVNVSLSISLVTLNLRFVGLWSYITSYTTTAVTVHIDYKLPNSVLRVFFVCSTKLSGGSVAEWLACWTQAQKGPGSNRSRDAVG